MFHTPSKKMSYISYHLFALYTPTNMPNTVCVCTCVCLWAVHRCRVSNVTMVNIYFTFIDLSLPHVTLPQEITQGSRSEWWCSFSHLHSLNFIHAKSRKNIEVCGTVQLCVRLLYKNIQISVKWEKILFVFLDMVVFALHCVFFLGISFEKLKWVAVLVILLLLLFIYCCLPPNRW